ncbi:LysR family transcriptional regulator [Sneathiella chinensis]|uniref:Transcriptional regulator n=1 Tax=Sneathiella chinensis TaxID=349750 RepID=A0ABQ5U524_9PROT|nr:LysR family transcriptional regulator [Sneathiella chinensis]GLQ06384.1 transcriptional regulator [Sneathiella chinensis]
MTYAQFRAFYAVAMERSFQKAADRLGLTQPAVSIQVRNLERETRRLLFRRSGHDVALTDEGKELFRLTRSLFDAEAQCRDFLTPDSEKAPQVLHLGADGPHVALDVLARFRERCPDVQVRVTLANADQTWRNLTDLRVDAAVMANAEPAAHVVTRPICRQSLVALVPRAMAFQVDGPVTLQALAELPLVFREAGSNTQQLLEKALARNGVSVTPALIMGSREGVREAVVRGLGVGFLFDREVSDDPRHVQYPVLGMEDSNTDMLLVLKDQRHNPLIRELLDCA